MRLSRGVDVIGPVAPHAAPQPADHRGSGPAPRSSVCFTGRSGGRPEIRRGRCRRRRVRRGRRDTTSATPTSTAAATSTSRVHTHWRIVSRVPDCAWDVATFADERPAGHGDRQPHARLVLSTGAPPTTTPPRWPPSTRAVAEGADIVDIGGVKAGPGDDVDAAEEIRRASRRSSRRCAPAPGPGDQRRHLARRGRARGLPRRAPTCSTTPGAASTRTWPRWPRSSAPAWSARTPAALPPRTRPHRVGYDDVVADVVATRDRLAERAVARRRPPRRGAHRPRPRLRQEHLALARGDPAAGRAGRHRLAGARRAVATRTSSARRSTVGTATGWRRRWPPRRCRAWLGRAGVPRARGARRPGECSTWSRRSRGDRAPARSPAAACLSQPAQGSASSELGSRPGRRGSPPRHGSAAPAARSTQVERLGDVVAQATASRAGARTKPLRRRAASTCSRSGAKTPSRVEHDDRLVVHAAACATTQISSSSSSVPSPPGSARNASAARVHLALAGRACRG